MNAIEDSKHTRQENRMTALATSPDSVTTDGGRQLQYKVKDLSLAEFGRKEIRLAEQEMPGLMAVRKEYAQPASP